MIKTIITPRFNDMDGLGHISNTTLPTWFEEARADLFKIFHPSLELKSWPLILARVEIDFVAQIYWGSDVEIRTSIGKLGTSSCHVTQEAWQKDQLVAKGLAIMIYFDYKANKSQPIPDDIRQQLEMHAI